MGECRKCVQCPGNWNNSASWTMISITLLLQRDRRPQTKDQRTGTRVKCIASPFIDRVSQTSCLGLEEPGCLVKIACQRKPHGHDHKYNKNISTLTHIFIIGQTAPPGNYHNCIIFVLNKPEKSGHKINNTHMTANG